MLAKCANPACAAKFLYLHEGKLFLFEPKPDASVRGPPADQDYVARSRTPRYFWLCSSCSSDMTLRPDGDHGVTVVRKQGVADQLFVTKERTRAA